MDKENPAKKIKNVPADQDGTLPFTREQFETLLEATFYYDGRGSERNGATTNSRRARAYLKLLRWSGLRAGDAACLPKSKLRDDDSLFLYQAKVKGKSSAPVYVLLPPDVADELRDVPPNSVTHPDYFFWSGRSKRKVRCPVGKESFGNVVRKAKEKFPKLFIEAKKIQEQRKFDRDFMWLSFFLLDGDPRPKGEKSSSEKPCGIVKSTRLDLAFLVER